jgi:hypothetical protein
MILLVSLAFAAFVYLAYQYYENQSHLAMAHDNEDDDSPPPPDRPRVSFNDKPSTLVLGWPSTGGVLVLNTYNGIELSFLGLNRFNGALRTHDPVEEDAHCSRMTKLGAVWFESDQAWGYHMVRPRKPDEIVTVTGWPTGGGVWVLKTTLEQSKQRGLGRISNALNMDERCKMIKMLDGSFYSDPKKCPDLDLGSE